MDDLASLDPELYNGLIFLKHYAGNPEDLSLNFTVAVEGARISCYGLLVAESLSADFGVTKTVDLVPNGGNIAVTKENRLQYIYLVSHYRLSRQIKQQSDAFFEGLSEIIDHKWLKYVPVLIPHPCPAHDFAGCSISRSFRSSSGALIHPSIWRICRAIRSTAGSLTLIMPQSFPSGE